MFNWISLIQNGIFGVAGAWVLFFISRTIVRSVKYKKVKKENDALKENVKEIERFIWEDEKRKERHEDVMDKINSGHLNDDAYSELFSTYSNTDAEAKTP